MAERDRASWGGDAALYRLIVSNGVEATAARFVNLSQYDAASGLISGVVWAVSPNNTSAKQRPGSSSA